MRLSYLKEFIELSSDLNYSAASKRLHMSVSALSTHISALEKDLGVTLVDIASRSLTPEGSVFLSYAYRITDSYAEAKKRCLEAQKEKDGVLKVDGLINSSDAGNKFRSFLVQIGAKHPDLKMQVIRSAHGSIITSLREKQVDVGMIASITQETEKLLRNAGIASVSIGQESTVAVVLKNSSLGYKDSVEIKDFQSYNVNLSSGFRPDTWRDAIQRVFEKEGVHPRFNMSIVTSTEEWATTIFEDDEVLIFPESLLVNSGITLARDDRVIKPFSPPLSSYTYICYRQNDNNPALKVFLEELKETFPSKLS